MLYLIDSDWFIDYLDNALDATNLIQPLVPDGIAISIISYIEVYQGVYRRGSADAERALAVLLTTVPMLSVSIPVAQRCAQLRESLRQSGRCVHNRALDLIIAATAIEHDLTLVTRNTDDYRDIPGLKLYR